MECGLDDQLEGIVLLLWWRSRLIVWEVLRVGLNGKGVVCVG